MLDSLYISNFAVIRSAEAEFPSGFCAITGETGAGKSVLMNGLGLLLGDKPDRELLRAGENRGEVSAMFSALSPEALRKIRDAGLEPDEEGKIQLSREVREDGRSSSRVNGKSVSLSQLRDAACALMMMHGQSANHEITTSGGERQLLDHAAVPEKLAEEYRACYRRFRSIGQQIGKLRFDEKEKARMQEMLRYQIQDIQAVSPVPSEEEQLFEKKLALKNAGKIQKQAAFAYRALRGAEKGNAVYVTDRAAAALKSIADVLPEAASLAEKLDECLTLLQDAADGVEVLTEGMDADPEAALDAVESRLAALEKLKRKYGGSVDEVLRFYEEARASLEKYDTAEEEIARLTKEIRAAERELTAVADKLHATRASAAERISAAVTETLHFLDMPKAVFRIAVTPRDGDAEARYDETGGDDIVFLLAANPGELPQPVARAASGGELARIMLAIRSHLSGGEEIGTVIYDEVDTGVSGKTARKVGMLLKQTAERCQIICVTHSAQIASLAERHLLVVKEEKNGRAESSVRPLDRDARVDELARILGGIRVTEAQKQAAEDLLSGKE